jgi:Asp/Glu/hydantoin racemase
MRMVARIAFIHTVGFLADEFRKLMKAQLPEVDCIHTLNESLLQDLLRGSDPALVYRRVVEQVVLAADAGASLIVMTCSSTSPGVDIARQIVKCPILKIDDPMAEAAIRAGDRIGLLCTATSTVRPSTALLQSHAAALGCTVSIHPEINAQAYTALMAGDRALHDKLVRESAVKLAVEVDVLVLAQASLAHLRDGLAAETRCPVLASPPLLMRELAQRLGAK